MRFLRILIPALLVISLAANLFMWLRWRRTRPVMTINGDVVTEKEVMDYLQQERGPAVKKDLTLRILIDQQAKKYHLTPTKAEIDADFKERRELDPRFSAQIANSPWYETEAKNQIRVDKEQLRLRAKDITVTDDDIRDEYNRNPLLYDTKDKAHVNLALIKDLSHVGEIKQLLEKGVSAADIQTNFSGAVVFPGDNQVFTMQRPFGSDPNSVYFRMKPNEVRQVPITPTQQQQGIQGILVRMIDVVPGHKYDPNDPKAKELIRLTLASKRMKPLQEWLAAVWAETVFTSENQGDKQYIEYLMFPERPH